MKQLILFATLIAFLSSCDSAADKTKAANLEIAKKYMLAVEANDVAAMSDLLADNYKGYGPNDGDSTNKEDAIKNWKYNAENLYESIKYSRHFSIAVTVKEGEEALPGDWVSNWAYLAIKYKDGRGPVHVYVNAIYIIKN
jgi:hypothetical protein